MSTLLNDMMSGDSQTSSLRARLETAEEELETLKTQLMLEQQRVCQSRCAVCRFFCFVLHITYTQLTSSLLPAFSNNDTRARHCSKSYKKSHKNVQRKHQLFRQSRNNTIDK